MWSRFGIGSLFRGVTHCRRLVRVTNGPMATSVRRHSEGPAQPFDNMPFKIRSPVTATIVFAFFFGIGLWAPFLIVWYSMAKKTM